MEEKTNQFYRVIKKLYLLKMSQKEIAESEGISTATVCRIIRQAEEQGYVTFELHLPVNESFDLESRILEEFDVSKVTVVNTDLNNPVMVQYDVAQKVVEFLNETLTNEDILGLAWGKTISCIADHLKPIELPGLKVVCLHGGVAFSSGKVGAEYILSSFADHYHCTKVSLPVPTVVDTEEMAELLRNDSSVKPAFDLIDRATVMLLAIGTLTEDSILVENGFFTAKEFRQFAEDGYVGNLCSRLFLADGSYPKEQGIGRILGVTMEQILKTKTRICVAMDPSKARALYGALRGGLITHLFVDRFTAERLLEIEMPE